MNDCAAQRQMPKYRCHKEVWALKIAAIEFEKDGAARITPKDEGYAQFVTSPGYRDRAKITESDLGYYVVYLDGYSSWSPSRAFEDGYTLIA